MSFKISLAGDLGSGKSTVSKLLIERTGAEYYYTGAIFRDVAAKHGMNVVEFNVYLEKHPEVDREIDDGLVALSEREDDMIIDSRMAWHFVKNTFSVYLTTDMKVSAARILGDHRETERFSTLEETVENIKRRKASEKKRYFEQYGVDCKDLSNYSLVVDTTGVTPNEIAELIISALGEWQKDAAYKKCYICPTRLIYKDESDPEAVEAFGAALERGDEVDEILAFEHDGNFYVASGNDAALAYSLTDASLIPVTLVEYNGEDVSDGYVTMADSL